MDGKELAEGQGSFNGTMEYHKITIGNLVATDGVAWLAKKGKCYWLIDAIASYQGSEKVKALGIQFWKLVVRPNKSAYLYCEEDEGKPCIVKQEFEYTDFPLAEQKIWVAPGEVGGKPVMVAMLPGEY